MKLVVYSSQTRGFDSRIFVVWTVNKRPQAKHLLVLDHSLELASVGQGLQDVITRCSSCKFEKVSTRET
jgi:hypothetical protein